MYRITFISTEGENKEVDIPYKYHEDIWYCCKKRKKYVVKRRCIVGVWATNIVGVILNGNEHIDEEDYDKLFRNKEDAIDWCIKQNQRIKVKVYEY